MNEKYPPNPVPDKPTDAAIVLVPGIPAIPIEPIVITNTAIKKKLKSMVIPVVFAT